MIHLNDTKDTRLDPKEIVSYAKSNNSSWYVLSVYTKSLDRPIEFYYPNEEELVRVFEVLDRYFLTGISY